ncbi:MAG TPA: ABC transporter ATP-binding protein [Thermoleophilaceae bacterium]|nr:ABC transporter ATP-binding protein [Thermoleophilaceae bacterium]
MKLFTRLLGFLRPYKRPVLVSFGLAALARGAAAVIPYLVGVTIDRVRAGNNNLWPLAAAILGAGLVNLAFSSTRRLVAGQVSLGVEYDLRNRMYAHLQSLELGFFDAQQTGQLMSRATVDLQAVRFFLGYGLVFILQSLVTVVVAGALMFSLNAPLALLTLAPMPLLVWVAFRYGRRNRPASQEVQQRIAELTADVEENVSGIRVVKAFAQEERQLDRFEAGVGRVYDQSMVSTKLQAFYQPVLGFIPMIGMAAVLLVGGRQAAHGSISIGDFVAFYGYVAMLTGPVRMLGMALGMAQRAVASGARVFELLDRPPRLTAPAGAPPLPEGRGAVEMRDVTVAYEGSQPVLRDVNLSVAAGETVALVGPTGSGKTTLAALIPRLYDPVEGAVLIDGADVREVDPESLRHQVALVSDDAFLFSAPLRENIAYARPDARDEDVRRAASLAGLDEVIESLPDGYETIVGERGLTLSGGQRQRVAIARALIQDPRILILDDATSSLDASTEARVKQALREVMKGRTTVIIGHRLSTIALADRIAVLDGGRLVAVGTHDDLIGRSELYREIAEKGVPERVFLTRELEREAAGL